VHSMLNVVAPCNQDILRDRTTTVPHPSVAASQVLKFSESGAQLQALGEALVPGHNDKHFCKPTAVSAHNHRCAWFKTVVLDVPAAFTVRAACRLCCD